MTNVSVDSAFTRSLPKVELHAHLTGSISPQTLHSIWLHLRKANEDLDLADPLERLSKDKAWDVRTFFPLFSSYIYALIATRETIIWSTNTVLHDFWADGVVYLELRTTPRSSTSVSKAEYIEIILDCINNFEHKSSMSTYLILSVDRRNTPEEAMEVVNLALAFREQGIVGIDLCGDPSKGDIGTFAPAFKKAKEAELKITLHFAEIPASSSIEEMEMMLSFRPDRLGHVIRVPEHVRKEIEGRKLGVELCISCNIQAGLTNGGAKGHHFGTWRGGGSPVILCTDDVGIFGSPLSNEYLLAAQNFDLSRRDLVHLCYEATDAIFGGEEEQRRLSCKMRKAYPMYFAAN